MRSRSASGKRRAVWLCVLAVFFVLAAVCAAYLLTYYHAAPEALAVLEAPGEGVTVKELPHGQVAFVPPHAEVGFVFYPGGKVQAEAYAPLLARLAREGILCVLEKMPFHLAVFAPNAAARAPGAFPDIKTWYVGGHSLGGVMAANYAAKHAGSVAGVVLLASYSTRDLHGAGLRALSVTGSEDGVLNREKYASARCNLPEDSAEAVIPGGCHAYFGSYGAQKGDGAPSVTPEEQQRQTALLIASFMRSAEAAAAA